MSEFDQAMSNYSDLELYEIIHHKSNSFHPEALTMVKKEFFRIKKQYALTSIGLIAILTFFNLAGTVLERKEVSPYYVQNNLFR